METPKNVRQQRPVRNPTPRLSERKKSLFATNKGISEGKQRETKDDILHGITPLVETVTSSSSKSKRCIESLFMPMKESGAKTISFLEVDSENKDDGLGPSSSTIRRSHRLNEKNNSSNSPQSEAAIGENSVTNGKENIPLDSISAADEQLENLFLKSMQINGGVANLPAKKNNDLEVDVSSAELSFHGAYGATTVNRSKCESAPKRMHPATTSGFSPQCKVSKVVETSVISTKAFYRNNLTTIVAQTKVSPNITSTATLNIRGKIISPRSRRLDRYNLQSAKANINKGVRHKIRRRPTSSRPKPLPKVSIDDILSNVRNEKLHKLIAAKRKERVQIEKAHSSFRLGQNPISMARPLSSLCEPDDSNNNNSNNNNMQSPSPLPQNEYEETDFSDIDYDSEESNSEYWRMTAMPEEEEQVIPLISHQPTALYHQNILSPDKSVANSSITPTTQRKFFKSGRSSTTRMEVKITDNIKASVCNGKILLVQEKRSRKRTKIRNSVANEFSDEQATVDAILKNLDDTAFGDILNATVSVETSNEHRTVTNADNDQHQLMLIDDDSELLKEIQIPNHIDYSEFRKRLPYQTRNTEIIEQQHLLLDFLISNNICTEENFTIFIADPDNHKEEAARIVNQVIVVVNEQTNFRQRLPFNTCDPVMIEQQHSFLDFLIEHNICSEENFDIFIVNYEQRFAEAEAIVVSVQAQQQNAEYVERKDYSDINGLSTSKPDIAYCDIRDQNYTLIEKPNLPLEESVETREEVLEDETNQAKFSQPSEKLFPIFYGGQCQPLTQHSTRRPQRLWAGGIGSSQYQIDAGQKRFGAHQCKQCGLVYTVHEPEEEKLHRDYHASMHVLRFKGWIDEDIVSIFTEWGTDGRILRITESSHIKRRERLMDILKVVDKELGFSSYIIPKIFVAYFAVRKNQIVGICLVQPLEKANKYFCINGLDCCTEEEFPAKCGISRIWVAPLHRRLRIASKLIQAVQLNTIFGEEITFDKIAFSAPTENGKIFAQKVTQTENFLVYQ